MVRSGHSSAAQRGEVKVSDHRLARRKEPAWQLALRTAARLGVFGLLVIGAGRIHWTRAQIYLGLILATFAMNVVVILWTNPELLRERMKKDEPTEPFDRILMLLGLVLAILLFLVAGLNAMRFGWSHVPIWWFYPGVVLHTLGDIPVAWSMATNPYLERTVRIQEPRGHYVVTSGPYRFVRHPMYVGVSVMLLGTPLILGSLWAFLPVIALIALTLVRTAYEDRMLRVELPGYEDYAQHTRWRLIPGVW